MNWSRHEINGLIYWRRIGPGPRLLLLHGMYGDHRYFAEAAWNREIEECDLIAPDLPGFGESAGPHRPVIEGMADQLRPLLQPSDGGPTVIVAHSMATSVAARLIDGAAGMVSLEGNVLPAHLKVSDRLVRLSDQEFTTEFERLKRSAETVVKWETAVADPVRRRDLAESYRLCSAGVVRDVALAINEDVRAGTISALLVPSGLPLLTVFGAASGYGETQGDLAVAFPEMSFQPITNSRHFPMLDNPEQTYRAIGAFVRKVTTPC